MKAKWYVSALLFISLCFGAFQEQVYEPNQEIVLEFTNTSRTENSVAFTINQIKASLLKIGATNIKIQNNKNGSLKIGYYSTLDVQDVKAILTEKKQLNLLEQSKQKENKEISSIYNLDVYELKEQTDLSSTTDNKFILEIKYQSDRFTTNHFSDLSKNLEYKANRYFKTAFKISKSNPFAKDFTSHKEPEVRAGPQIKLS